MWLLIIASVLLAGGVGILLYWADGEKKSTARREKALDDAKGIYQQRVKADLVALGELQVLANRKKLLSTQADELGGLIRTATQTLSRVRRFLGKQAGGSSSLTPHELTNHLELQNLRADIEAAIRNAEESGMEPITVERFKLEAGDNHYAYGSRLDNYFTYSNNRIGLVAEHAKALRAQIEGVDRHFGETTEQVRQRIEAAAQEAAESEKLLNTPRTVAPASGAGD